MEYQIKEVAKLSGTTVRTLHHYHDIGLLVPDHITDAGYRIYTDDSLIRLRHILFLRELGFTLKQIKSMIHHDFDEVAMYRKQKHLLQLKIKRLEGILDALDQAIDQREGVSTMSDYFKPLDKSEIESFQKQYAEEVRERYDADVIDACDKRIASYDNNKWKHVQTTMAKHIQTIADCMEQPPSCDKAQKAILAYRMHITDSFYDCTPEILKGLGQLYVCDERFTQYFEKFRPGLAKHMKDVIDVYCEGLTKE